MTVVTGISAQGWRESGGARRHMDAGVMFQGTLENVIPSNLIAKPVAPQWFSQVELHDVGWKRAGFSVETVLIHPCKRLFI